MSSTAQHTTMPPLHEESRRLEPDTRALMERSMGASFGDVVVHTGTASTEAAGSVGAAAFTVGRHVVFGPDRYDPGSLRGRMLLAHELAHVVQQRRGGGDLDLLETTPLSSVADRPAHAEGHQQTAAQAALGASAPVAGASAVGVARATPEEESDWWEQAKESGRNYVKGGVGTVEGVALEAGQIVDTVLWAQGKAVDLSDAAIDYAGESVGLDSDTREVIKAYNQSDFKRTRALAAAAGMVDKDTGAITVSPSITKGFDVVDETLDATAFEGVKPEESFLTTRDIGQIEGAIGSQVALSFVGVEEVQLGLKVVSGIGAFKAVVDAIDRNRDGFGHDRAFWMAIGQAVLHVAGLKAASSGKKLLALAVHVGMTGLAAGGEVASIVDAYNMPEGPERDERLKAAIKGLIRVVADQIRQMISSGKGLPKKGEIADPEALPAKTGTTKTPPEVEPPATTTGKSTPQTDVDAAPVKTPVKAPVTETETPPAKTPAKTPATTETETPPAKKPAKTGAKKGKTAPATETGEDKPVKAPAKSKATDTKKAAKPPASKKQSSKKQSSKKQSSKKQPSAKKAPKKGGSAPKPTTGHEKEVGRFDGLWDKARPEIWKKLALKEMAARAASESGKGDGAGSGPVVDVTDAPKTAPKKGPAAQKPFGSQLSDWDPENPPPGYTYAKGLKGWEGIDPIKTLTDAELAEVAKTGKMPARVEAELEHARIPQRVGRALVRAGLTPEEASALTKQTDPENLEPVNRESHAWMDELARIIGKKRNPSLPAALDDRKQRPLASATNAEIEAIVAALKKPGVDLETPGGKKIRAWLAAEKEARKGNASTWEVP